MANPVLIENLTKREYFAARALQGMVAKYNINNELGERNWEIMAQAAVVAADALIVELSKNGK